MSSAAPMENPIFRVLGKHSSATASKIQNIPASPSLVISGITVPAGGNATLVYQARVNDLAPLGEGDTIVNTVTVTGGGIANPVTDSETITAQSGAELTISKAICPAVVTDNSRLTYTFVIQNTGNLG